MMNPQDDTIARGPDNLFGDFPDNILHTVQVVSTQWWVLVAVGAVMPGAGDGYCLGVATVVTTIGDPGTWPACDCAFSLILSCVA